MKLNLDPALSKQENFLAGQVVLLDKPLEWTSFDVVKKVRRNIRIKKVGHAGTLDPLATGLLILCTGKRTKSIEKFMGQEKEYTGSFFLGKTTPTYDLESEPEGDADISQITEEVMREATNAFSGAIQQVPPIHSAIKIAGKRVYQLARKGEDVKLEPRSVFIREFEITKVELPTIHFRVVCSKGTYIRSLANDFGKQLGTGAYLSSLRRTRIGEFSVEDAYQLTDLIDILKTLE